MWIRKKRIEEIVCASGLCFHSKKMEQQILELQRQLEERDEQIQQLRLEALGAAQAALAAQAQNFVSQAGQAGGAAQNNGSAQANGAAPPIGRNVDIDVTQVENILRTMRTPQILRDLPSFSGEAVKLHAFIRSIENLIPLVNSVQGTPMYTIWMQSIRSKIVGDADSILELYGTGLDWAEIKQNLITHYSDRRDEVSLTRDLFKLYQTGTIEDYYGKISHITSLLINLLNINERNEAVKTAKNNLYQQMGLKVFLSGLRDPLGPIVRAQSPATLKDALRLCLEENNYNLYKMGAKPANLTQPLRFQPLQPQLRNQNHVPQQRMNPIINQPVSNWRDSPNPLFRNNQQIPQLQRSPVPPQVPPRNFQRPEPMEVDRSIRSRQINYMNRARSTNGPHYQIEVEEADNSNQPDEMETEQQLEHSEEIIDSGTEIANNIDDLNFCMALDNNVKR